MKAVILAGGYGTRLAEETHSKPKPMIEIGGKPLLWHIMKIYSAYGIHDFIICLGFKGYVIKEYFSNYFLHTSDITIDLCGNDVEIHNNTAEPWRISLIDTGTDTMTGGRIRRIQPFIKEDNFLLTYGDGVSDVNITNTLEFHKSHNKIATITAVKPPARFGAMELKLDQVNVFREKPIEESGWINGGFFVLNKKVFDYLENDSSIWEREPLEMLAREDQLRAYRHNGFWQPVDTLREKHYLEKLWQEGSHPWKIW